MQSRRNVFGFRSLLTLLALSMAISAAPAQSNTTALTGTITDATGALMPGVVVTATNPANGQTLTEKTGAKGEFSFEQVMPGTYTLHVIAQGFTEQVEEVQLLVATPLKLNFKLSPGASEVVEVSTPGLAAINSTDGTLGKAFDSQQVQTLPYLANNITYLLSLQPGVLALDSGAQTGGLNVDTRTGIVNGARQDQTNVTLDGVDNNDQTNGYAFNGALRSTRESVEEFRVTTTNANADAGRSSGGQVSLVTRSGTNAIHGAAYEYYRGGIGLQNNWFNKQTQATLATPKNVPAKVLQHTYGGALGTPLLRDKLFFFGAYEGFKQASSRVVQNTVPSIPGGGGLVTGNVTYGACAPGATSCSTATSFKTLTPTEIASLDNRKGNANCAKPGVVCNAPASNAAALAYFKQFPIANGTALGDGVNTGSYTFTSSAPLHQITNIARLDYNLNQKQSVFVRGNLQSDNQATTIPFPGQPASSNIFSNNKGIAAGHAWSISNALTNNFRYGLIRQGVANRGSASQPYVTFTAFNSITATGTSATSSKYLVTTNNFADDMTFTKGRHTFQFGVNDRFVSNSRYFDSPLLSNGSISANLLATAAIAGKNTSLDTTPFIGSAACPDCAVVASNFRTFYNSAILANTGLVEAAQSGTEYLVQNNALVPAGPGVVPTHIYNNLEQEYYFQDQWKATPRLTITAGLRYVYLGTPYEINGQQIAPTISLNTFLQNRIAAMNAGTNYTTRISFAPSGSANGAANFWSPQKKNFAPRFAFAYATADNKTSIRGGYAIAYDHVGEGIIDNYESTSGSLLSLSKTNQFTYSDVDTNPRFNGYNSPPLGVVTPTTQSFPVTPTDIPFSFLSSINNVIQTPYAQTFNLSVQREVVHGMTVTASYVGRLGRHLLANLDVAQPLNLLDPTSGQSYFAAATAFDKMIDAGTSVLNVPDSGYFHNLFPNATYTIPKGANAGTYKGARAYYAYLAAGDRGNETDPLFTFDTDSTASASGQSFRFFYPQTSSIFAQSTVVGSNYNALQLSMRHALRSGLVYDFNYTYSKSLDQGSSPERSSANLLTNTFNPGQQYAPSDFDVRHNITADYTLPLPFGHGQALLTNTNGFVDRLVGGMQLNGTVHYSTGFPFTASANGNYGTNFDTSSYFIRTGPIASGGHNYVPTVGGTANYQTALKNGTSTTQAFNNFRYAYAGEVGERNAFREDGYFSLDSGFSKSFRTFREQNFKISVEVFNVTGTPRFALPAQSSSNGASTKFGQYTTLLNSPRQMQFSGKYTF